MILFRSETPLARGLAPIHTANAALAASASHSGSVKGAVLRTHLIGEVVFIAPHKHEVKMLLHDNTRYIYYTLYTHYTCYTCGHHSSLRAKRADRSMVGVLLAGTLEQPYSRINL